MLPDRRRRIEVLPKAAGKFLRPASCRRWRGLLDTGQAWLEFGGDAVASSAECLILEGIRLGPATTSRRRELSSQCAVA